MIMTTVADLLNDNLWPMSLEIYVVCDGDVVFCVGQSKDLLARLEEYIGRRGRRGPTHPSQLGRIILDNQPESREWTIELWSVEDCKRELSGDDTETWDKDIAEYQMILARRPHLNVTDNPHERRLPEKYYSEEESAAQIRVVRAIFERAMAE